MTWQMIEAEIRKLNSKAQRRERVEVQLTFVGPRPRGPRDKLFAKQNGCCWLCGYRMTLNPSEKHAFATFDHVKAESHGGTRELSNLMLAHALCNNERGNHPPYCVVPRRDPKTLEWKPPRGIPITPPPEKGPLIPFSGAWLLAHGYIKPQGAE